MAGESQHPMTAEEWAGVKPMQGGESRHYRGPDVLVDEAPPIPQARRTASLPAVDELLYQSDPVLDAMERTAEEVAADEYVLSLNGRVTEEDVKQAFLAGIAFLRQALQPKRGARGETPLLGTAETRTLAAALELFIDQVLIHLPAEMGESGEFLGVEEARGLVAQLRGTR